MPPTAALGAWPGGAPGRGAGRTPRSRGLDDIGSAGATGRGVARAWLDRGDAPSDRSVAVLAPHGTEPRRCRRHVIPSPRSCAAPCRRWAVTSARPSMPPQAGSTGIRRPRDEGLASPLSVRPVLSRSSFDSLSLGSRCGTHLRARAGRSPLKRGRLARRRNRDVAAAFDVKRVCLAYSGGLDTSVILHWLIDNYDCEVVAYCRGRRSGGGARRAAREGPGDRRHRLRRARSSARSSSATTCFRRSGERRSTRAPTCSARRSPAR